MKLQVVYSQYANMEKFNHRAITSRTDTPASDGGLEELPLEFMAYGACIKTPRPTTEESPVPGTSGTCRTADTERTL